MKRKYLILVVILVLSLLLAVGCNKGGDNNDPTPTKEPEVTNTPEPEETEKPTPTMEPAETLTPDDGYFSDEPTIYAVVVDEKAAQYFKESHPTVVALKEQVEAFDTAYNTVDYRTLTGEETFPYLTEDLIKRLQDAGDIKDMVDYYTGNKISTEARGINNYVNFSFNFDMSECIVSYVSLHEVIEMSEEFSSNNKASVGDVYGCKFAVKFVMDDGQWKISDMGESKIWLVD